MSARAWASFFCYLGILAAMLGIGWAWFLAS